MDEPAFESGFLRASRVAIWGLGLMGGSLAMALNGLCAELVGIDSNPSAVSRALELGIVSSADTRPAKILPGTDLVVLAIPVGAILTSVADLPEACPGRAVVIDLGSTKREIVAAMARLPERFDPIGGHPMCGKEKSSLEYAEAGLYLGATFVLTALQRTSEHAHAFAEEVVRAAGARPLWMEAEDHDRVVAATSHMPFLLASALAKATPFESAPLVGPGFRSTTRLAGSSTAMMVDILKTNTGNIRVAMSKLMEALAEYEALLELGNFQLLAEVLEKDAEHYQHLIDGRVR